MNQRSKELLKEARFYCNELSKHNILAKYWDELSLVLKGSTARGNADQYSDIDLVFFCKEKVKDKIVTEYYYNEFIGRQDGVFIPLPEWIGHYNIETYEKLIEYFKTRNYEEIWEYSNVIILHDKLNRLNEVIHQYNDKLFDDILVDIKEKYLTLQLALDWLRHPLKRGDEISVILYCFKIIRLICQLSYLLDKKTYPNDKWIFYYIGQTKFGYKNEKKILELGKNIINNSEPLHLNNELHEYSQYAMAQDLITDLMSEIKSKFGNKPWLDEWYLYV